MLTEQCLNLTRHLGALLHTLGNKVKVVGCEIAVQQPHLATFHQVNKFRHPNVVATVQFTYVNCSLNWFVLGSEAYTGKVLMSHPKRCDSDRAVWICDEHVEKNSSRSALFTQTCM